MKLKFAILFSILGLTLASCGEQYPDENSKLDMEVDDIVTGDISTDEFKLDANFTDNKLSLDARKDDFSGRLMASEDSTGEDLSLGVKIVISGYKATFSYVDVKISEAVIDNTLGSDTLLASKYLTVSDKEIALADFTLTQDGNTNIYTYDLTIDFIWGEKFNSMNPADYFDEDENGKLVDNNEVRNVLNSLASVASNTRLFVNLTAK